MRKLKLEELKRLSVAEFKATEKRPVVVILDNVRSMHNVGSVLRTSDAFLIEKVFLCGITPKPPHREIRKTAIGAEESVDWQAEKDAFTLVQKLQAEGFQIAVVEQADESIVLKEYKPGDVKLAVVFGHEVEGVQDKIVQIADVVLEIEQFGTKHSLNISVAAGIVLHHLTASSFINTEDVDLNE